MSWEADLATAVRSLWIEALSRVRRLFVGRRRWALDGRLRDHGLSPAFEHASPDGMWVVHYDGQIADDIPAGGQLDSRSLLLSAELTIAHGHLDLPTTSSRSAEPGGDSGTASAILFGTRGRRAALRRFFGSAAPAVEHRARISQSTLTLEVHLPADAPDATIRDAFAALAAAAEGMRPGLTRPLPEQLAEAAGDRELPAPLRASARRKVVVDFPFSAPARPLGRPLLGHHDPLVALSAALVVDEPERIAAALRTASGPPDLMASDLQRWADALDRARTKLDGGRAAELAETITHRGLRQRWLEALIRGGYDRPARRALVADPIAEVRAAIARPLADHAGRPGTLDFELEHLLLAALEDEVPVAAAAAGALAAHGTRRALRPLSQWRAGFTAIGDEGQALAELIDAGLDRIRGALDPALAGQLSVMTATEDGGLTLADSPSGGLSPAEGDR